MSSLTQETLQDWAQLASEVSVSATPCDSWAHSRSTRSVLPVSFGPVQADRDPHRIHWLLELMAEEPLKGIDGSFQDARLAQCALHTAWETEGMAGYTIHQLLLCVYM